MELTIQITPYSYLNIYNNLRDSEFLRKKVVFKTKK